MERACLSPFALRTLREDVALSGGLGAEPGRQPGHPPRGLRPNPNRPSGPDGATLTRRALSPIGFDAAQLGVKIGILGLERRDLRGEFVVGGL